MPVNRSIMKTWYIYMMRFYSVLKKRGIMKISGKWVDLEITELCELSKTQRDSYHMFSLICGSWLLIFIPVYLCESQCAVGQ